MKQKKIGTTLYVFSEDPYVITEDTDANIIYIQEEVIFDFAKINIPLISKMKPINYHIVCIKHPEWADYYNDFTVYVEQTTGGTVTAYPTSGDEGEEIQVSHLASERYDFDHWNIVDEDGNEIEVKNGKFLMPASNVTVSAVFKINYNNQYLTIESLADDNVIKWKQSEEDESISFDIQYSTNKIDWITVTSTFEGQTITTLDKNEIIYIKGNYQPFNEGNSLIYGLFVTSGEFKVYGNIMSLSNSDDYKNTKTIENDYQFCYLFNNCYSLKDASDLILPATTLNENCYEYMFYGCSSLTSAPAILPATTLNEYCYYWMFTGCTSLTSAPELPATTLAKSCYQNMFQGCTSLTKAPSLPAITLISGCYRLMFQGCTSLNSITMLATDISAFNCLRQWVKNVAASGTFTKSASMTTLPTGDNGIPSGWTVQDA